MPTSAAFLFPFLLFFMSFPHLSLPFLSPSCQAFPPAPLLTHYSLCELLGVCLGGKGKNTNFFLCALSLLSISTSFCCCCD